MRRLGAAALLVALAAPGPAAVPAGAAETRTLDVWLGPSLFVARGVARFGQANPDLGIGPGFAASLHGFRSPIGARVDLGMATVGNRPADVLVPSLFDSASFEPGRIETSTRVSWALVGPEWRVRSGDVAAHLNALVGLGGARVEGSDISGLIFDPPGRPASHRGFCWGAGAGVRKRVRPGSNVAAALGVAYRALPGVDFVGAPPFDSDASGSRYRVEHGTVHVIAGRIAVEFTRQ